ncbi:PQQ-dependent catabolism-associated CXXCW motif protein [Xanthobacter agilis]|jgi:PQQ-dependent catabolism-associated CXXCW motif protein|nr:PQQ-dependent catabolism-associated CXXCW motif protein [Xanthobacter agilis]
MWGVAAVALGIAAGSAAAQQAPQSGAATLAAAPVPPEPSDYHFEPYRAPTPQTLSGAEVLSPAQAQALWRGGQAVFVDVLPRPPRPAALPADTVWRDPPHASIPGALWLPNVGFGALDAATERYFHDGLKAGTDGDLQRQIVVFCLKDCWMSWNAAKRALAAGYRRVAWFPEGADGWTATGLPLERLEPWQPAKAR